MADEGKQDTAPADDADKTAATAGVTEKQDTTAQDAGKTGTDKAPDTDAGKQATAKDGGDDRGSIFDDLDEDESANAPVDAKPSGAPAVWPDDWREKLAGGDAKYLSQLKRHASFDSYAKSQRALAQKISSGEFKQSDPFDETWPDERKAEWRKERGVPDKPDDYETPEIKGYEWSETDASGIAHFKAAMHAVNADPATVKAGLEVYATLAQQGRERLHEIDREDRVTVEDSLRAEWGNDYRSNLNVMARALKDAEFMPGGLGENGLGTAIMNARLPDGHRLVNHPDFARFLVDRALERYGEAARVSKTEIQATASRKAEIEKVMQEDMNRYYRDRNAKGQTMEEEYREIMAQEAKYGSKAA